MSLKEKTIKGLFWSGFSQAGKQISQLVITIILARLLSPDDFGLLAMATVFINFAMIFSEMGISSALIQKQDTNDRHYYSAFWFNIIVGVLLTLVFIAVSPIIAWFYNKPELQPILIVISVNFFLSSFVIIQQTILSKEMDFKKLAIRDILAVAISGIVGIYLAYHGFGVWSLVYQSVIFTLLNAILLWTVSTWRPKFVFAIQDIKDIFHFSANLTGFNVVNYFARNVDQLLIGKYLGAEALGYYALAYKIMLYPIRNISWVIGKVMFPAFSRIQNDIEKLRNAYIKEVKIISMVSFPAMLGMFAIAPDFVFLILGHKWQPAILLIRILCFCGLTQSVSDSISGNIRLSTGNSKLHLKIGIGNAFITIISVIIGLNWGIYGVAYLYTLFSILWSIYTNYITLKIIKLKLSDYYYELIKPMALSITLILLLLIIKRLFS
ncbi:MAG: MOP flippase family protein [Candidatus Omnitrophica bacterium]|nr:MOP flippase family protein [Candidatus Omnitrophota bacterium]